MLYISRILQDSNRVGGEAYGVVDTDDDVEELVDIDMLSAACFKHRLNVCGVTCRRTSSFGDYIGEIEVWQDPKYVTAKQSKLRMLTGVDLKLYKDEISYLAVDGNVTTGDISVRLSDYGKRMHYDSIIAYRHHSGTKRVFLVIDDKFLMKGRPKPCIPWVCWDIREWSDFDAVSAFYHELMHDRFIDVATWNTWVLDKPERSDWFMDYERSIAGS